MGPGKVNPLVTPPPAAAAVVVVVVVLQVARAAGEESWVIDAPGQSDIIAPTGTPTPSLALIPSNSPLAVSQHSALNTVALSMEAWAQGL